MGRVSFVCGGLSFVAISVIVVVLCGLNGDTIVPGYSTQLHPIELLTIQSLMHVPECAADKHCRSACRLVCQETTEGLGTDVDHTASLIAFGCCFNAPLIEKEVVEPGREVELLQENWPSSHVTGRRTLLSTDHALDDRHSLQADYDELKQQETALKRRLSLLPVQSQLPFKVAKGKQVQGLMEDEFNGFNEGFTDGEYGWNSSRFQFIPDGDQGGWFASNSTSTDVTRPDDPFGTEWHLSNNEGTAIWNHRNCTGDGCPHNSDGWKVLKKFKTYLQASNGFGRSARFYRKHKPRRHFEYNRSTEVPLNFSHRGRHHYRPNHHHWHNLYDPSHQYSRLSTTVGDLGEPIVEYGNRPPDFSERRHMRQYDVRYYTGSIDGGNQEWNWPNLKPNSSEIKDTQPSWRWNDNPDLSYYWCRESFPIEECDQNLNSWYDSLEWRPKPCGKPPLKTSITIDEGSGLGLPSENVEHTDDGAVHCGFELVNARKEEEHGYDAGRGLEWSEDIDKELSDEPSEAEIKHFLGSVLYKEYRKETADSNSGSPFLVNDLDAPVHRLVARGIERARRRMTFKAAYDKTEWEWCLKHHKHDADFPRACTSPFTAQHTPNAKPYESRNKVLTTPEQIMNGVEEAFSDLIGGDKQERVRKATGVEILHPHKNRFEYGSQTVPSGHVQGFGPAWWERIKGLRDVPQTVEGKAIEARDRRKLPGVRLESWNGWPTLNRAMGDAITMTPGKCCSTFMHYSSKE